MDSKETNETTQKMRTEFFRDCVYKMDGVDECGTWGQGCAPTLNMLRRSEIPKEEFGTERFGETYPLTGRDYSKPTTSVCNAYKIWN